MNKIIPILHNIRSIHNVGSILRTADGLGLSELWVSGYTPYPKIVNDQRLPHVIKRVSAQIAKTSLGAEKTIVIKQFDTVTAALDRARNDNLKILALEQTDDSLDLTSYKISGGAVLLMGNEVEGLDSDSLKSVESILEIPMHGKKESFNVSVAAAIALYSLLNPK